MIKAIETVYNGYRFRSRLEARWAVFFDTCGIKYAYEPEGFVTDCGNYLPDFELVDYGFYVEIKPNDVFSEYDKGRIVSFSASGKQLYVLCGNPFHHEYSISTTVSRHHQDRVSFELIKADQSLCFWQCPICERVSISELLPCRINDFEATMLYCFNCDVTSRARDTGIDEFPHFHKGYVFDLRTSEPPCIVKAGFLAARQARFEFGENGRR